MKPKRRPNVFDLVKASGVSRGTISRALNGGLEINEETRRMVLETAERIGYVPHPGARSMKAGKTNRFGFLVPNLKNSWYAELTEAIDHVARERGKVLVLGMTHYSAKVEHALIRHWAAGETDGMIVCSSGHDSNFKEYAELQSRGFPLVFLYGSPRRKFDYVTAETESTSREAFSRFGELGHRRIAYVGMDHRYARSDALFKSYEEWHREHGLELDESLVYFHDSDYYAGDAAWEKWRAHGKFPTAVFCTAAVIGTALQRKAREAGLTLPRDLSIIAVSDTDEAERAGISSIRIAPLDFGNAAFDLLARRRGDGDPVKSYRIIRSEFITRASLGPPQKKR